MAQRTAQNSITSLLVVESNVFFQQDIEAYFAALAEFRVIAISNSTSDGIELCHMHQPDIVLFDLTLLINGTAETGRVLSQFRKASPSTRIVIWGDNENSSMLADVFLAGPDSYMSRKQPMTDLLHVIKQLRDGHTLFYVQQSLDGIATYIGTKLTQATITGPLLTRREQDVLNPVKQGDSNIKVDPYPIYARMRDDNPICCYVGITGENPLWMVTRYQDVQTILRDHKRFVKNWHNTHTPEELSRLQPESELAKLFNHHMLNVDGAEHTRLRSLVSKVFSTKMINQQREQVQATADQLIDAVEAQGHMDLIDDFAFPLPIITIAQILGIPPEDRDRFRVWSRAVLMPNLTEAEQQEADVLLIQFMAYLRQQIDERHQNPQDDLITGLLQAEEDGKRLSEQEIFSMVRLLITAGHETTVHLIGNAMRALFAHPEQMTKLREDPSLIGNAIEEFLRYDGPVERTPMYYAAEDTELGGFTIRRGDPIMPVLISANRDPRAFGSPDDLDITRPPSKHLGFGFGIHYCLGAPLARLEGAIAVNTLLRRLPNLRLAVEISALEWSTVPTFHGTLHLPVKWGDNIS